MNTIDGYLSRFPMDKKGRELRTKYLTELNKTIIIASEGLTKEV